MWCTHKYFRHSDEEDAAELNKKELYLKEFVDDIIDIDNDDLRYKNESVSLEELKRLKPGGWLSSDIINYYLLTLEIHNMYGIDISSGNCGLYIVNTYFYTILKNDSSVKKLKRLTKNIGLDNGSTILIPIHIGDHWILAEIHIGDVIRITIFDSLGGNHPRVAKNLKNWFEKLLPGKSTEIVQKLNSIPQQANSSDCGIFMLLYLEYLIGTALELGNFPDDISQIDVLNMRIQILKNLFRMSSEYESHDGDGGVEILDESDDGVEVLDDSDGSVEVLDDSDDSFQ